MRHTSSNKAGMGIATLLAGPAFLSGLMLAIWSADMSATWAPSYDASGLVGAFFFGAAAVFVGAIVAVVPNMIGSWAMRRLGQHNPAMRLPVMWGLVGGLATGLPLLAIDAHQPEMQVVAIGFIVAGTACGLLCRYRVSWDDAPCPLSAPRSPAICT